MKDVLKWIVGVVIVFALILALPYLFRGLFGFGYGGMMGGSGNWGHPMMGGYFPFGGWMMGIGMLLVWIVPLGLLFLAVYGAVRLANKPDNPPAARNCSSCGKPAQADWHTCPYCGTSL